MHPSYSAGKMARRTLLSIDGGGIRGILPACLLAKLEQTTGRPARDTFQFLAGTSTGALLAASLAAGLPAKRILDIYVRRGPEIFRPRKPWNTVKRALTGSAYSIAKLRQILCEELGDASAWDLNRSPVDVLLTAKGLDGTPWYFVKDKPANSRRTGRFGLVDCATASAAAPTYFGPFHIPELGTVVDGGVGVTGNPVYQACVEAFCYTGEYTPEETTVVSLGTGRFPIPDTPPRTLWGWLEWVLAELLRSPGEQQTELVQRQFPNVTLYRLDADLKRLDASLAKPIDMDDIEAIPKLVSYGEKFAAEVDWPAILEGGDERYRIRPGKTKWSQYRAALRPYMK
jgi:predicted acylesterase/phospholipase RssA